MAQTKRHKYICRKIVRTVVASFTAALCSNAALAQSTAKYDITVVDPNNKLGGLRDSVLENLTAALDDWSRFIPNIGVLAFEVRVMDKTASGRFSGRAESAVWLNENGEKVLEECSTHKLRTGNDTNGTKPEIIVEIEPEFMCRSYWIDPAPLQRTLPVPKGKIDLVTVFAHEITHGLGINGRLNRMTGELPPGQSRSQFDSHIINATSANPVFRGKTTSIVYGGDLPLTKFSEPNALINFTYNGKQYPAGISSSQNYYHYGKYTLPGERGLSLFGLMGGAWPWTDPRQGLRIRVGVLDAAILNDLGIPTVGVPH